MDGLQATFEKVATVETRDQNGSIVIPIDGLLQAGGYGSGQSVHFTEGDDHVLLGRIGTSKVDGRRHKMARAINAFGGEGSERESVAIPPGGLDHLDIDVGDAADGVPLDLWVCKDEDVAKPIVAITPKLTQRMQFEVDPILDAS